MSPAPGMLLLGRIQSAPYWPQDLSGGPDSPILPTTPLNLPPAAAVTWPTGRCTAAGMCR